MWVIVGDVAPADISKDNRDVHWAVEAYVEEAGRWVEAVTAGRPVDDLMSVNVPLAQLEHQCAEMRAPQLDFIRNELVPNYGGYEVELG